MNRIIKIILIIIFIVAFILIIRSLTKSIFKEYKKKCVDKTHMFDHHLNKCRVKCDFDTDSSCLQDKKTRMFYIMIILKIVVLDVTLATGMVASVKIIVPTMEFLIQKLLFVHVKDPLKNILLEILLVQPMHNVKVFLIIKK